MPTRCRCWCRRGATWRPSTCHVRGLRRFLHLQPVVVRGWHDLCVGRRAFSGTFRRAANTFMNGADGGLANLRELDCSRAWRAAVSCLRKRCTHADLAADHWTPGHQRTLTGHDSMLRTVIECPQLERLNVSCTWCPRTYGAARCTTAHACVAAYTQSTLASLPRSVCSPMTCELGTRHDCVSCACRVRKQWRFLVVAYPRCCAAAKSTRAAGPRAGNGAVLLTSSCLCPCVRVRSVVPRGNGDFLGHRFPAPHCCN